MNGLHYAKTSLAEAYRTKKDYTKALKWFHKAARQGSHIAQYSLGLMYLLGEGVLKDREKALNWLISAATKRRDKTFQENIQIHKSYGKGRNTGKYEDLIKSWNMFDGLGIAAASVQIRKHFNK